MTDMAANISRLTVQSRRYGVRRLAAAFALTKRCQGTALQTRGGRVREYKLISGDSHWQPPAERWAHRVPERYRDRLPKLVKLPNGGDGIQEEDGRVSYGGTGHFCSYTPETFDPTVEHFDTEVGIGPAEQRLREQDVDGVDAEILFGGAGTGSKHPELRQAFVHAYNGYLAEGYCSAAPDRLPKLKIYWAENQIGWIPIFLEQMDMIYDANRFWAQRLLGLQPLQRKPSEYAKEHAYWGFFDDPIGVQLRDRVGVDHILWGSDFPHEVSRWPHSQEVMDEQLAGVPVNEKRKMLAENAVSFFHLDR